MIPHIRRQSNPANVSFFVSLDRLPGYLCDQIVRAEEFCRASRGTDGEDSCSSAHHSVPGIDVAVTRDVEVEFQFTQIVPINIKCVRNRQGRTSVGEVVLWDMADERTETKIGTGSMSESSDDQKKVVRLLNEVEVM